MNIPVRRGTEVKAGRGTELRCKGWRQEAILRLLENNIENAEAPDNLVVYMSIARAARDWSSFDRIVATLAKMREDETLIMQSGKPIGVFPGQATTPLVIMANGNLVGDWSGEESRRKLDDMGLTVYPGMTAAAWQYIGSQGILQGTYETFMAAARQHFGGTLAGRLLLTSGCGGMSGAQPLAGKLAGASTLVIEVDQARIDRRIASGYCDATTSNLDEAVARWQAAHDAKQPLALALCANSAAVLPELARRGIVPDIVTDQTFPDPLKGYVPAELTLEQARAMRQDDPARLMALARQSVATHVRAMLDFPEFFKAGVAQVAPGSPHAVYPDFEEYQGVPVYSDGSEWRSKPDEVPANWKSLDLEEQAGRLQGHLMIQVGEEDENVLPASTLRFADALMKADKNFELILVPNANHVLNFGPPPQYLLRRGWDWLVRYLRD